VRIGDKIGFIDKIGKVIIKPQFGFTRGFTEGIAYVAFKDTKNVYKYGFIDKTGKFIWREK